MGKYIWAVIIGLTLSVCAAIAWAGPIRVCVTDEHGKTKCVSSQPANAVAPNLSADIAKLNAAKRQISAVREQLKELGTEHPKASAMDAQLKEMEKRLSAMDKELAKMSGRMGGLVEDAKMAIARKAAILHSSLGLLALDIKALQKDMAGLKGRVRRLEGRRVNLEVGAFGGGAYIYGGTGGALVTLALPMGESGLWTTRLTAGLGISPSVGVGWLGMATVSRSMAKGRLELGPAAIAMGDQGDLLSGNRNWLLGGGAELRLHINRHAHFAVTPFIGVTTATSLTGVGWQDAVYKDTACGSILVKEAGYARYDETRQLKFTGGALASVVFPLF